MVVATGTMLRLRRSHEREAGDIETRASRVNRIQCRETSSDLLELSQVIERVPYAVRIADGADSASPAELFLAYAIAIRTNFQTGDPYEL
jgi:hypothetical protein